MKIVKNPIFTFIIGLIIAGTCVFAYTYNASDIGYGNTNVADAIDDLYTTQNTTVTNLQSQNSTLTNQVAALQAQLDNPNCVFGTFTTNSSAFDTAGQLIDNRITPNIFVLYWPDKRVS